MPNRRTSRGRMPRISNFRCAVIICLVSLPISGLAQISLETIPSWRPARNQLLITVRNSGPSNAYQVRLEVSVAGRTWEGIAQDMVVPQRYYREMFNIELDEKARRTPVIITVRYSDEEGYMCSAVNVAPLALHSAGVPDIRAKVDSVKINATAPIEAVFYNGTAAEVTGTLRFVGTDELAAGTASVPISLAAGAKERVIVPISNLAGRPGSQYRNFLMIETEDLSGMTDFVTVPVMVSIISKSGSQSTMKIVTGSCLLLLTLLLSCVTRNLYKG